MDFGEIWAKSNLITGWFSEEEGRYYYQTLGNLPDGAVVVEVGVYHGRSTSIPAGMGKFDLYAVDTFNADFDGTPYIDKFTGNVPGAKILRGMSMDAVGSFEDESVDLVFIDADHTSPAVDQDCILWIPKLKHGGWMVFHDYQIGNYPDVVHAVDTYCAGWDGHLAGVLAFRRKP